MIYVLLGQTASGKTSLALKLARKLSLPILSADAYQCYRKMQIGTDKPKKEEVEGLAYLFYDCHDPDEEVNVSLFQKTYRPIVEEMVEEGKDLIVVGGTFLYIKALLFDYRFPVEKEEKSVYESLSFQEQVEELKRIAPQVAEQIDIHNPRRVLRALLQIANGEDRQEIHSKLSDKPLFPSLFFEIEVDKEEGNRLIDERVDRMFEEGFVEEVENLLQEYPSDLRSFQSLGYRELIQALEEKRSLADCKKLIKIHTHQYAKKQRTFLRHQFKDIHKGKREEIEQLISDHVLLRQRTDILLSKNKKDLEGKSILLCGIGGVGGIVAEGLARLGAMDVTLIDKDKVESTNLNRQILYTKEDLGKNKVDCAKRRLLSINPLMKVDAICQAIQTEEDLPEKRFDVILDVIDDTNGKALLYQKAQKDHSLYLTSAGFGFHLDSTKVTYGILKDVHDPLTKNFKKRLGELGITDTDNIPVVYPKDARRRGKSGEKTIGSLFEEVNAGGLAILTWLLKRWEERNDDGK